MSSDEQFPFLYFLNIALVREMSSTFSDGFDCYWHELVNDKQYLTKGCPCSRSKKHL